MQRVQTEGRKFGVPPMEREVPGIRAYLWPSVGSDLLPLFVPGETMLFEWSAERPLRHDVLEDLSSGLRGRLLVPESVANNARWVLTDRRLVLSTRGRSRVDVGVMHIRLQWVTHVITERYTYPADRKPATLNVSVVFDIGDGRRALVRMDADEATGSGRETALAALRFALSDYGLTDVPERSIRHDNGKQGTLMREYFAVGGSFGVPAQFLNA